MKVWILIEVKRGFIQEPEIYYSEEKAISRKKELLNNFNPDYDELEIFEKEIEKKVAINTISP